MKLLLDTHIFLWWISNEGKLSKEIRSIISNSKNPIYISVATLWEIEIKRKIGKIDIPKSFPKLIESQGFIELPVKASHIEELQKLPLIHKDPFDRILIAQANAENLKLVTSDAEIVKYSVKFIANK